MYESQFKSSGPRVTKTPRGLKKVLLCQFGFLRLTTARAAFITLLNIYDGVFLRK